MVNPRRLAIRGHGAGIADAIFVAARRHAGDFFSLARGQREIDRSGGRSPLELADMSGRREAQEARGLLRVRRRRQKHMQQQARRGA